MSEIDIVNRNKTDFEAARKFVDAHLEQQQARIDEYKRIHGHEAIYPTSNHSNWKSSKWQPYDRIVMIYHGGQGIVAQEAMVLGQSDEDRLYYAMQTEYGWSGPERGVHVHVSQILYTWPRITRDREVCFVTSFDGELLATFGEEGNLSKNQADAEKFINDLPPG